MSGIRWAQTATISEPPQGQKRKTEDGVPDKQDWDVKRQRIEELYKDHDVPQVKRILEEEGFFTTERNIRYRLSTWGNQKYLKLSEKQWRYIMRALEERCHQGKPTAFISKLDGSKLPSDKIQRTLDRKFENRHFAVCHNSARNSGRSSGGLMAYTPRVSIGSTEVAPRSSWKAKPFPGNTSPAPVRNISCRDLLYTELESYYPLYQSRFSGPSAQMMPESYLEFLALVYGKKGLGPGFILGKSLLSKGLPWGLDMNIEFESQFHRLQSIYPDSSLTIRSDCETQIFCVDCLFFENFSRSRKSLRNVVDFFADFERRHMLSQNHLGRVNIRMLGDPEPWDGRAEMIVPNCGHEYPDVRRYEKPACWSWGGCRWAQFKTVEETIAMQAAKSGSKIDDTDLSLLLAPLPDVQDLSNLIPHSVAQAKDGVENITSMIENWLKSDATQNATCAAIDKAIQPVSSVVGQESPVAQPGNILSRK